jgi:hydrogenase small subunit
MVSNKLTRRDFLRLGAALASAAGLSGGYAEVFAQGIERLSRGSLPVLWLQGQACSGCSISLLNAEGPTILQAIAEQIRLIFHPTLSATQGRLALEVIEKVRQGKEPFALVIEGSIPVEIPEACKIAGRAFAEVLPPLLRRARFVVAAGTCASYGGIPSAEGAVTGAASVREFMEKTGAVVQERLVLSPGCPCHPAELLGTLAHLAAKGYPDVRPDSLTPSMFSTGCLHYLCPRLPQFNARFFARQFGEADACLYQLGCRGLDVYADCVQHRWNGGVNWCIQASAPCIGCNQPTFAKIRAYPFYSKGTEG